MAEQLHGLTTADLNALRPIVAKHRQRLPDVGRRTRRVNVPSGVSVAEGVLTSALSAPSNGQTAPTTATMRVWVLDSASTDDPPDFEDGELITVVNRDTTLSATSGTYVIALSMNGEWRPIYVGCNA